MALATDVISDRRLREAIGAVGDESDAILSGMRDSAIAVLEKWFNRTIIDRALAFSRDDQFFCSRPGQADFIGFAVSDIKSGDISITFSDANSDPSGQQTEYMIIASTDSRVSLNQDRVVIYSGSGATPWRRVMRFDQPTPTIQVNLGMHPLSIPSAWGDAVALMVRAVYDGSGFDEMAKNSALTMLISPWKVQSNMQTINTR